MLAAKEICEITPDIFPFNKERYIELVQIAINIYSEFADKPATSQSMKEMFFEIERLLENDTQEIICVTYFLTGFLVG